MRKSLSVLVLTLVVMISFGLSAAIGETLPSSKAVAKVSNVTILNWTSSDVPYTTILTAALKTSQQKDLFIDVSLECGLYTRTLVKSKGGTQDTSMADAGIKVRVLIDGVVVAEPGEVVFEKRMQELSAKLGGILSCTDVNGDGMITLDECTITEEEIQLVLDTMSANSFNFILPDVGVGVHTLEVQAAIDLGTSVQQGQAEAKATIGKGSVAIEEVRMVKGTDIIEP